MRILLLIVDWEEIINQYFRFMTCEIDSRIVRKELWSLMVGLPLKATNNLHFEKMKEEKRILL